MRLLAWPSCWAGKRASTCPGTSTRCPAKHTTCTGLTAAGSASWYWLSMAVITLRARSAFTPSSAQLQESRLHRGGDEQPESLDVLRELPPIGFCLGVIIERVPPRTV